MNWEEMSDTRIELESPAVGDAFGTSVAVSGVWAFVGAPGARGADGKRLGAVYVYRRLRSRWKLTQKLQPSNLDRDPMFGHSLAVSGNWAFVATSADSIYVFNLLDRKRNPWWLLKQQIQYPGRYSRTESGRQVVAVDGNWAIVGFPGAYSQDLESRGTAGMYRLENGSWCSKQFLEDSRLFPFERFGCSVAIDGTAAVVGLDYHPTKNGAARVYRRSGSSWQLKVRLESANVEDGFVGRSVAIDDGVTVVGSKRNVAFLLNLQAVLWSGVPIEKFLGNSQRLKSGTEHHNVEFGGAVAIAGDVAVVCDSRRDGGGAACILERAARSHLAPYWRLRKQLLPASSYDLFGAAVAIGTKEIVIGAPHTRTGEKQHAGAIYVFDLPG